MRHLRRRGYRLLGAIVLDASFLAELAYTQSRVPAWLHADLDSLLRKMQCMPRLSRPAMFTQQTEQHRYLQAHMAVLHSIHFLRPVGQRQKIYLEIDLVQHTASLSRHPIWS